VICDGKGVPRSVSAGQRVSHRVAAHFEVVDAAPEPRVVLLKERPFPQIGIDASSPVPAALFECASWAHVSVRPGRASDVPATLPIELRLQEEDFRNRVGLTEQLRGLGARVARILVQGEGDGPPDASAVMNCRNICADVGLDVPVLASVRGYFVELNRGAPIRMGADGVAWPMAPSVHAGDPATILENVMPFAPLVHHLDISGLGKARAVVPLAWTYPAQDPVLADPKMVELWLTAALIDAAAAAIESVTLSAEVAASLAASADTAAALSQLVALSGRSVSPVVTDVEQFAAILFNAGGGSEAALVANASPTYRFFFLPDVEGGERVVASSPVDRGVSIPPRSVLRLPAQELATRAVAP